MATESQGDGVGTPSGKGGSIVLTSPRTWFQDRKPYLNFTHLYFGTVWVSLCLIQSLARKYSVRIISQETGGAETGSCFHRIQGEKRSTQHQPMLTYLYAFCKDWVKPRQFCTNIHPVLWCLPRTALFFGGTVNPEQSIRAWLHWLGRDAFSPTEWTRTNMES